MTINFTVRPLVEGEKRYTLDLSNILEKGCYSGFDHWRYHGVTASAVLTSLNSDTSAALRGLTNYVDPNVVLQDSRGYIKVPKPSAVVMCLRSNVEIVVREIFNLVKPVSVTLFPSVDSLSMYYANLDRDMLTQKRIGYLVSNSRLVVDTKVTKALSDLKGVPAPKAHSSALRMANGARSLGGGATVALVLDAPVLVGGHHKLYDKLWVYNQDRVGNEPEYYEADALVGELYQSCHRPESIREEGCVKCLNSSTCIPDLLSEQSTPNVINPGFIWVQAKGGDSSATEVARALYLANTSNSIDVENKLKQSQVLTYVKPYLARSENSVNSKPAPMSKTLTMDIDLSPSNIDSRVEEREELNKLVTKAVTKRKEHCSKCSMVDGCRPKGNKDWVPKFYANNWCTKPVPKYTPKEDILKSVFDAIVKNKYLYKIICLYSGAQFFYQSRVYSRSAGRSYKYGAASIGHITSLEALSLLDIPYIYFGSESKVLTSSRARHYKFEGYKLSPGIHISSSALLSNQASIEKSLVKAIVNTGLLRMYEIPYVVDKRLDGWVARLVIEDSSNYGLPSKASIAVFVPLQVALLGLGTLHTFQGMSNDLYTETVEVKEGSEGQVLDYSDHLNLMRTPVLDKKALAAYVKAYDIIEYPVWTGGGFSSPKAEVFSNVACSIKAGTGLLHITQYGWRIASADMMSGNSDKSLEVTMPKVLSVFEGSQGDSSIPISASSEPKSSHWYSRTRWQNMMSNMGCILGFRSGSDKRKTYIRVNSGASGYSYKALKLVELCRERFRGNLEISSISRMAEKLVDHYGIDTVNRLLHLNYLRDRRTSTEILDYTTANIGRQLSKDELDKIQVRSRDLVIDEVVSVMSMALAKSGIKVLNKSGESEPDVALDIASKLLSKDGTAVRADSMVPGILKTGVSNTSEHRETRKRVIKLTVLSSKDLTLVDPAQAMQLILFSASPLAIGTKLGGMNLLKSCNKGKLDCFTNSEEAINTIKAISRATSAYKTKSLSSGFSIRRDSYHKVWSGIMEMIRSRGE